MILSEHDPPWIWMKFFYSFLNSWRSTESPKIKDKNPLSQVRPGLVELSHRFTPYLWGYKREASSQSKLVPCSQGVKSAKQSQMGLFQITQEAHEVTKIFPNQTKPSQTIIRLADFWNTLPFFVFLADIMKCIHPNLIMLFFSFSMYVFVTPNCDANLWCSWPVQLKKYHKL